MKRSKQLKAMAMRERVTMPAPSILDVMYQCVRGVPWVLPSWLSSDEGHWQSSIEFGLLTMNSPAFRSRGWP